jgi:Flp pilus assembly CpaF family ATPase
MSKGFRLAQATRVASPRGWMSRQRGRRPDGTDKVAGGGYCRQRCSLSTFRPMAGWAVGPGSEATMTSTAAAEWASPLRAIERAAQDQAKLLSLDMGEPGAREQLRAVLDDQVARWRQEYRRGRRPLDIADPEAAIERALRNLTGYGPLEPLLDDPDVWEIMVNGPGAIFTKRHSGAGGYHHEVFHDDEHVVRVLTKILDDASRSHRKLDPAEGLQDAQLDNGARLHIVHSDVGRDGHLLVNIRKFSGVVHRSLADLIERSMLDRATARFLQAGVRSGLSILVAGAPGSGKTTLLGCLAAELDPSLRVVVAEEVFETDIPLPNVAHMQTRPARPERKEVDLRRLVAGFLRMAPDVAIVGEVRDREALRFVLPRRSAGFWHGTMGCRRPYVGRSGSDVTPPKYESHQPSRSPRKAVAARPPSGPCARRSDPGSSDAVRSFSRSRPTSRTG